MTKFTPKFTPEDVRAAYLKHGKTPRRRHFGVYRGDDDELVFDQSGYACGLSIMVVGHTAQDAPNGRPITGTAEHLFGVDGYSFMYGFDGAPAMNVDRESYELGRRCWEAVKDLANQDSAPKENIP